MFRRQCKLQLVITGMIFGTAQVSCAVDVTANDMTAQTVTESEGPLQIDAVAATELSDS